MKNNPVKYGIIAPIILFCICCRVWGIDTAESKKNIYDFKQAKAEIADKNKRINYILAALVNDRDEISAISKLIDLKDECKMVDDTVIQSAIASFDTLLNKNPKKNISENVNVVKALFLMRLKKYKEAYSIWNDVLGNSPELFINSPFEKTDSYYCFLEYYIKQIEDPDLLLEECVKSSVNENINIKSKDNYLLSVLLPVTWCLHKNNGTGEIENVYPQKNSSDVIKKVNSLFCKYSADENKRIIVKALLDSINGDINNAKLSLQKLSTSLKSGPQRKYVNLYLAFMELLSDTNSISYKTTLQQFISQSGTNDMPQTFSDVMTVCYVYGYPGFKISDSDEKVYLITKALIDQGFAEVNGNGKFLPASMKCHLLDMHQQTLRNMDDKKPSFDICNKIMDIAGADAPVYFGSLNAMLYLSSYYSTVMKDNDKSIQITKRMFEESIMDSYRYNSLRSLVRRSLKSKVDYINIGKAINDLKNYYGAEDMEIKEFELLAKKR